MPVRIYEIAKKVGLESKVVLAKAKELGYRHVRAASSTLDKISAEYLEQQLGYKPEPTPPAKPELPVPEQPEVSPAPSAPPAQPVPLPTGELTPSPVPPAVPGGPPPATPSTSIAAEAPLPVPPGAFEMQPPPIQVPTELPPTPAPTAPASPVVGDVPVQQLPSILPDQQTTSAGPPAAPVQPEASVHEHVQPEASVHEHVQSGAPPPSERELALHRTGQAAEPTSPATTSVERSTGGDFAAPATPQPPAESMLIPKAPAPTEAPAVTPLDGDAPPKLAAPVPPEPSGSPAQPQPAPPPVPPPQAPKVGDKVGFIDLKPRARPGDRAASRATQRQQPGKGRETVPVKPGATQASAPVQRGPRGPAAPPRQAPGRSTTLAVPVPTGEEIVVKPPVTVRTLAEAMKKKPFQVIADLMELGIFATVNQAVEPTDAQRVCAKYNLRFKLERRVEGRGIHKFPTLKVRTDPGEKPELLKPRAPVVTIMGHVDHGKTTLLDVIRETDVAANEAGGITQHIGAYTIDIPKPGKPKETAQITFLDTPGHAAFSAMRARGANVTDIVVLVVAANDGVMPQTLEAISHAKAAGVPIVVAVNKCDHPNANPLRVRQQLQEKGLVPDDWGGDTLFVEVSALTKQGIDKLLEAILLQADLLDLRANPDRQAVGNVIESGIEAGGPIATVLVRKGTLSLGDVMICERYYGRVRALIDEARKRLKKAGPSMAVRVLGLNGVPEPGAEFTTVASERDARELCEQRAEADRARREDRRAGMTIMDLMSQFDKESAKVLRLILKGDTQGSVEAIEDALQKIKSDKVSIDIIHSAVGMINESDVLLASASKAVIFGFHTRFDPTASDLAKRHGIEIRLYEIIYELIDDVRKAMAGLLEPVKKEVVLGTAEVRKVFALSKGGNVAGCVVTNGRLVKGKARIVRRRTRVFDGNILTLRRFQDEVNEVRTGMECGIRMVGFDGFAEGDTVECYGIEEVPQNL